MVEAILGATGEVCRSSEVRGLHPRVTSALEKVHSREYLATLARPMGEREVRGLDPDTFVSRASWNVTRLATSAWLEAVDNRGGFALARPPGHHAKRGSACGFGTLNHAAAAARYALDEDKFDRVGVLDIDVHFGNGCASILGGDEALRGRARYVSIHQDQAFPYTGGKGNEPKFGSSEILKFVPLAPGTEGEDWLRALEDEALPFLAALDPQLLIVCAGFDALATDTLAHLDLTPEDFYLGARAIRRVFPPHQEVPIVSGLEGGYDTLNLPIAIASYLKGLACCI
ncbi:hypothetical protein CTAYLR_002024 [Chrysophaeum taylorii]|uniref:Histone deacetylase domain-containing protein n=1 Tax=Chrysophaeum taylorii TaxID=2483200 RepID=A0AAD7UNB5_9STRA|nr:hypothetical protein CTAYLR_002024 [Chrysophaeum taylorii]